jgi:hypothetical protein
MKSAPLAGQVHHQADENSVTRTLSRWADGLVEHLLRSSRVNRGSPFCGLRTDATTTSSKSLAATSMMSRWPLWIGSNEPGYRTLVTVVPRLGVAAGTVLPRYSRPRSRSHDPYLSPLARTVTYVRP